MVIKGQRNKELLKLYKEPNFTALAKVQTIKWQGQKWSMDNHKIENTKSIRIKCGRPKERWKNEVEKDLNVASWTWNSSQQIASMYTNTLFCDINPSFQKRLFPLSKNSTKNVSEITLKNKVSYNRNTIFLVYTNIL